MLVARSDNTEAARLLVQHGANVNAKNGGGVTALMIAAAANQSGLVNMLVKAGADVAAQNEKGETALSIARENDGQAGGEQSHRLLIQITFGRVLGGEVGPCAKVLAF